MNDVRYEYKYQPLGYELNNNKGKSEEEGKEEKVPVENNQNYENTNFLNLPKGFKIGG